MNSDQVDWVNTAKVSIPAFLVAVVLLLGVTPFFSGYSALWIIAIGLLIVFGGVSVLLHSLLLEVADRVELPEAVTEIRFGASFRTASELLVAGVAGAFAVDLAAVSNPAVLSILLPPALLFLWAFDTVLQFVEYQIDGPDTMRKRPDPNMTSEDITELSDDELLDLLEETDTRLAKHVDSLRHSDNAESDSP